MQLHNRKFLHWQIAGSAGNLEDRSCSLVVKTAYTICPCHYDGNGMISILITVFSSYNAKVEHVDFWPRAFYCNFYVAVKHPREELGDLGPSQECLPWRHNSCPWQAQVQNNMASDKLAEDSRENLAESEHADNQEYVERVKKILKPLEKRWDYVQSVLLWEKPSHSLCYFIAMTVFVG